VVNEQSRNEVELKVEDPVRRGQSGSVRAKPPVWQKGKVVGIIVETPETNTLQIEVPDPTPFLPGQYYNIRIPIEGRPRPIQRAYSIGSSPFPNYSVVDVGIRETPGGLVSPRLVRESFVGQELEVRGPYGAFTWTEQDGGPVLLIGAGSGVVPLMAMIRYQVSKGLSTPMHLLFSSKGYEYVIYRDDLERLESENGWLTVSHAFTRAPGDERCRYHRRIDKEMISEVFHEIDPKVAYLCGPPEMVEESEKVLLGLGMPEEAVKTEKYD
jgi:ferredoxin-NADP reductase